MARKRRLSRAEQQFNSFTLKFFLFALAMVPVVWVFDEVRAHPLAGGLLTFLLVLGGGLYGVYWWKRREQRQIEAQRRAAHQFQRSMAIAPYHEMSARDFEDALAYLCARDGCTQVQRVGGANDHGADVIATTPDGRRMVIQAKRYARTNPVGNQAVQIVEGTYKSAHRAQLAVIVTTSRFTRPARQYAQHVGIRLFDEPALAAWASRTGPAPWH